MTCLSPFFCQAFSTNAARLSAQWIIVVKDVVRVSVAESLSSTQVARVRLTPHPIFDQFSCFCQRKQ
jgi:hypothetical protein